VAKPTWVRREQLLLEAIAAAEEAGERVNTADLVETTGLGEVETQLGIRALYDAEFIDGSDATTMGDIFDLMLIRLLELGRQAVGQWPSEDQYAALLAVLDRQISEARDADERTRLERLRDAAIGAGREVAVSLLTAWTRYLGGPPV